MAIDRKEKILKAAIHLWEKHGAAFTRLSAVAKAAKVPAPLIHYYFKSEEDLHFEIILRIRDEILDYQLKHLKRTVTAVDGFKEYLKGPLLWATDKHGSVSIWIYFYYLATFHPRFREFNTQLRKIGRDRIAMMIYEGVEKGEFHLAPGTSVKNLAHDIQCFMNGILLVYMSEERDHQALYYIDQQEHHVMNLLGVKNVST